MKLESKRTICVMDISTQNNWKTYFERLYFKIVVVGFNYFCRNHHNQITKGEFATIEWYTLSSVCKQNSKAYYVIEHVAWNTLKIDFYLD